MNLRRSGPQRMAVAVGSRPSVVWLRLESQYVRSPDITLYCDGGDPQFGTRHGAEIDCRDRLRYSLWRSAAAMAAPTIPASLSSSAGLTGVCRSRRGTHFSASLLTPPPTTNRSGVNNRST